MEFRVVHMTLCTTSTNKMHASSDKLYLSVSHVSVVPSTNLVERRALDVVSIYYKAFASPSP